MADMDVYLVGGAVRDSLLGLDVTERDWVVVGAKPQLLLDQGYQQVGKDFPVFLHPKTKEEYAMARIERKISSGHGGFVCDSSEHVTLEEDLLRRDLTINAIAQNKNGDLVDPYGGEKDLASKVLRHVSKAFSEDPLRVLRLARFYGKLPDFTVAPETLALVSEMVASEQLAELPTERVWMELSKSLTTQSPSRFFNLLGKMGAIEKLWPEIQASNIQQLMLAEQHTKDKHYRLALALIGIPTDKLTLLLSRLKLPNNLASLINATALHIDTLLERELSAEAIVTLFYAADAFRRETRFKDLLAIAAIKSDIDGVDVPYQWQSLFTVASNIGIKSINPDLSGPAISEAIRAARVSAIQSELARH